MPAITLLFAGIFGLMSVAVSAPAGILRGKTGISIGDGGNPDLLLAMRRHANFIEYVPLALILMALVEMNGMSTTAMYVFGSVLVVARICHAFGLKKDNPANLLRGLGAGGTVLVIVVMSIWGIILVV